MWYDRPYNNYSTCNHPDKFYVLIAFWPILAIINLIRAPRYFPQLMDNLKVQAHKEKPALKSGYDLGLYNDKTLP